MRDALSLLDQCIAFHLGQELTYDKVLDVLGAVDTGVFSRLLRSVLDQDVLGCITLLEEVVMQGRELTQFVTDFTWYMRNLMLVKSTDNLEDVIDMSTDNLNKLKEEAQLVEVDQIIRYIRIFSDLAGKIKYATQKRILVEIALIKLCKPQMETDSEAMMDRIRQVEDKLEKGVVVTTAPAGSGVPGMNAGAGASMANTPKVLPKAVPEDVKQIVTKWPSILGNIEQPMKGYLKKARLSLGTDDKLLFVMEDGFEYDYFAHNEDNLQRLKIALGEFSGKEVDFSFKSVESSLESNEVFPDLTKFIDMEIDEEDDDIEENGL